MLAIAGVSVITGIVIYLISQSTRRGKSDAELLVEIPESAPATPAGS
jgi:hypothetical protein